MIKCEHWRACGIDGGGCCNIDKYEQPSFGVCLTICQLNTKPKHKPRARGFGDTVSRVIKKLSRGKIKQCGGCKKRQQLLNKLIPYGDKNNGNS